MSELKKIHCNTCKRETNHELLAIHNCDHHEDHPMEEGGTIGFYEDIRYGFWVCKGCDTASLEEMYTCSGMRNDYGEDVYDYTYAPERTNKDARIAKKFMHINKKLSSAYSEIIKAHEHGLEIITAIGIRALLEGICVEQGIDDNAARTLTEKIKILEKKCAIPKSIIEGLNSLKYFGDSAAHRLDSNDMHTISLSIDLLEALLVNLYEAKFDLEQKAELVNNANKK